MTGGGPGRPRPSLMRSLGEFVGHVVHGIRSRPGDDVTTGDAGRRRIEVERRVEEEDRDGVILRRTTIEEVELPPRSPDEEDRGP